MERLAKASWLALALILASSLSVLSFGEDTPTDWKACLNCHSGYQSSLPKLSDLRPSGLGALSPKQCLECHDRGEISAARFDWTHPVRPAGSHLECTMCHPAVAHGKGNPPPKPKGDYEQDGCFKCHRTVEVRAGLYSSHFSYAHVGCIDCHAPHEPLESALPSTLVPSDIGSANRGIYDWYTSNRGCLSCHPPGAFILGLSRGFVSYNKVNYHDLHVIGGSVLCVECHDPHGSIFGAMLRSQLLTGELLVYSERISGGTCSVICHGVNHREWEYTNSND